MEILFVLVPVGALLFYQQYKLNKQARSLSKSIAVGTFLMSIIDSQKIMTSDELKQLLTEFSAMWESGELNKLLKGEK